MTQHTPGPWIYAQDTDDRIIIAAPWSDKVRSRDSFGFGDYRGIHVAAIRHHAGAGMAPRWHAEANARLIAAAPDLLAACQAAIRVVNEYTTEPIPAGVYSRLARVLGDAIAKASRT